MFIVVIDPEKCIGCGECTRTCPARILEMKGDKAEVKDNGECMGCQGCVSACPVGAITVTEY